MIYTVVLLRPDYMQDGSCLDGESFSVEARNPSAAIYAAQREAQSNAEANHESDYRPVAVFEGGPMISFWCRSARPR